MIISCLLQCIRFLPKLLVFRWSTLINSNYFLLISNWLFNYVHFKHFCVWKFNFKFRIKFYLIFLNNLLFWQGSWQSWAKSIFQFSLFNFFKFWFRRFWKQYLNLLRFCLKCGVRNLFENQVFTSWWALLSHWLTHFSDLNFIWLWGTDPKICLLCYLNIIALISPLFWLFNICQAFPFWSHKIFTQITLLCFKTLFKFALVYLLVLQYFRTDWLRCKLFYFLFTLHLCYKQLWKQLWSIYKL